jgi:segregation and condensation protein A
MDNFFELELGESYTGPLDLLYLLMKKEEIPFDKISIAKIADQYLECIKDLESVDLSSAGDFLALATRLMVLKARELLPHEEQNPDDLPESKIETETLLMQLQEYRKFKYVALELQKAEEKNFGTYSRGRMEKINKDSQLADVDALQLLRAFHKTLQAHSYEKNAHGTGIDNVTLEDRQLYINTYLATRGRAMFDDLIGKEKLSIMSVVTFMAMLENTKDEDVVFRQSEATAPLWLYRKKQNDEYKEEIAKEKIYYSPDPEILGGLADFLRDRSLALEIEEKSSLDSVLKVAMQLIDNGVKVGEDDIQAMLEGVKC